jgi:RNA polymerase sigma-70 factor (ECF subfamily)
VTSYCINTEWSSRLSGNPSLYLESAFKPQAPPPPLCGEGGNFSGARDITLLTGIDVTSDDELMGQIRNGSGTAFELLFERYRAPVWRFFRRRTMDAARAEELAQDTFVAVLKAAVRYETRGAFRAFLFGIAYNVLLSDRRKAVPRVTDSLNDEVPAPCADDLDTGLWIRQALAQLSANDREVLMLREYEQLTYEEIAAVRQVPVNTVRSQLFRARMALRDALQAHTPAAVRTCHGGH